MNAVYQRRSLEIFACEISITAKMAFIT